ncbi:MAG: hypothetical protein ABSE58_07085 [Candidatus Limnocylindrales bacterium]|jgi:hypothetical protein
MFGSFNPPQELPLTVVTAQLIIQGTLRTRVHRLTDVVNEPDATHLVLFDARFMELGSRRVVAGPGVSQVQLSDVLFVHSSGPSEAGGETRTPKQAVKAILLAPPFTIEGLIHLPYESELHQALDAFGDRFVPVTAARYWAYSVAESPNDVDFLVVNRARAHVAVPATVKWLREPPLGPESGGAQNPW